MKREIATVTLQGTFLFKEIPPAEMASFTELGRIRHIKAGEYVYRQGDPCNTFRVVVRGEIELLREVAPEQWASVGRIGPGGHFGETALLAERPHSVSARALTDLALLSFDRKTFLTRLVTDSRIQRQLYLALAERLRIAFLDQAENLRHDQDESPDEEEESDILLDRTEGRTRPAGGREAHAETAHKGLKSARSIAARFAANQNPYMLTGETGTGKRYIAHQIHRQSEHSAAPYREIDLRQQDPATLLGKLVGKEHGDANPFSGSGQSGILDQISGGTLVFFHAELLLPKMQQQLVAMLNSGVFARLGGTRAISLQTRLAFIFSQEMQQLTESGKIIPELLAILQRQHYRVPPLREHKRDLNRLIEHYLRQFSREFDKDVHHVPPETMGLMLNYDWPGNINELVSVLRRGVMLAKTDTLLADQILLGLPKSEGKWEFNVLRIGWIRSLFSSRYFPLIPRIGVGMILLIAVLTLFFGPTDPRNNFGISLCWSVGWPLMFFSFFLLARTWCSVCTLAMPGMLMQHLAKPHRKLPQKIKNLSGWIMALFCILVLWVEVVWHAYDKPALSGWIILTITIGSLVTSTFFSRRAWCRYLCPLGAINAILSMPSIIELRSNRHFCINHCQTRACFAGGSDKEGCPMFRHPYLVDNNRDCIVCGACIKDCANQSIQLNLRLAPQELWSLHVPRWEDSFLIVSLCAIFFPFTLSGQFQNLAHQGRDLLAAFGLPLPVFVSGSLLFFALIALFQGGYMALVYGESRWLHIDWSTLLPRLGYGFIPLILGGFMATHLELFVRDSWQLLRNLQHAFDLQPLLEETRLISRDSTFVLQALIVLGGLGASLFATYRIIERLLEGAIVIGRMLLLPYVFLLTLAALFLASLAI